ncbi:TRAF3-interacting JNK-activating modulator [Merluccius polli]|uniref:TRAF3-interacting JNK-activating modulator n=1 Tax=Merluccius polli TaxID=89951 RepID=A0AA47MUY9_MERPO|nr:TRAF3-interacting JNK-activating modulator [Merluccius polli]
MDTLDISVTSPVKDFDQIVEKRAEKYQHLRGRNNMTSCRSPMRVLDTKLMKDMLQHKRHLEFERRRSRSPELYPERTVKSINCSTRRYQLAKTGCVKHQSQVPVAETVDEQNQTTSTSKGGPTVVLISNSIGSDDPSPSKWASLWSEPLSLIDQKEDILRQKETADFTSIPLTEKSIQQNMKGQQATSIKTIIATEDFQTKMSSRILIEETVERKILRDASVQTERGFVTVKELDVQQLAEYMQEALWREESLKKKMDALQQNASSLLNSSNNIWTARCNEDLLTNKITSLEAQLQLCVQGLPKDGLKKLVLHLERQKQVYEKKALAALQKATLEKTEALVESHSLQEALKTAKAQASRWQGLYEEQKQISMQLKECHERTSGQVDQLHSELELSMGQQAELRGNMGSLQRVHEEMQHNISLLEQTNQTLRNDIRLKEEPEKDRKKEDEEKEESLVVQELRDTQERLRNKGRQCVDLEAELEAMQQEYRCSQARLTQCRDELRLLSQRHSSALARRSHRPWTWTFLFLIVLLAFIGVAMLSLWHPPFRGQVADIFSDIETRIEDYLMDMASQQQCYRPV